MHVYSPTTVYCPLNELTCFREPNENVFIKGIINNNGFVCAVNRDLDFSK